MVLGAGGHGKVVQEVALSFFNINGSPVYEAADFLDDNFADAIGKIDNLGKYRDQYSDVFCGIGNNTVRNQLSDQAEQLGYVIPVLIHPTAYISPSAVIEAGTVVEPKAIVNANTAIHRSCIISVGAKVESSRKLEAGEVVFEYGTAQYKSDELWVKEHKEQFGAELSFMQSASIL